MSREIKFRARDGKGEVYFYTLHDVMTGKVNFTDEEWIIEQYIELKDRNGKEIYEGDVLSKGDLKENPHSWGVVTYGVGTYDSGYYEYQGWYLESPDTYFDGDKYISQGMENEDHSGGILIRAKNDHEVIGNIHDNPQQFPPTDKSE